MQRPSYLLQCAFPTSTFIESFIYLYSSFHKMFGPLLGLRSFDIPKGPLVCKQTSLPITFDGVRLILTSIIAPTTYLRNWAFVISIIFARFMVDQCPSFLKLQQESTITHFLSSNTLITHVIFQHPQPEHVFFHSNNSLDNKWFNFEIPSWIVYTIVPFLACFSMRHLKPIVPKFDLVLGQGQAFGLQFDQSSQPFDYLPQFFAQHFICDLYYPILQS